MRTLFQTRWLTSVACFVLFSFGGICNAEDWTRFRGNAGSGIGGNSIPVTFSNSENLAWKTPLPGRGSSSPVVIGNKVFLTAFTGYAQSAEDPGDREDLRLHVLCLSLSTGEIIWDRSIEPAEEEQSATKRVVDHGYASPTPCVDDKNVYAFFGPSGIVAYSQEGDFLWRQSVGTKTAGFGAAASPIVFDDLVIMNASIEDGAIYGIDKSTGEIRYRTDEITRSWTTPTIVTLPSGKTEMVVNQKNQILGLDPLTGKRLWFCEAIQDYIVPVVVADGDTLYCSGGRSNKTFVIKAGGRGDVTNSHLVWEVSKGANVTSPLLNEGYLYWSHDKAIAMCLRASDGEEMFRERMPTRGRVYGSIVSDGQSLFLTTRDAGVLVLAAQPDYQELAINRLGDEGEMFSATPAIVDGRLLIRSDSNLYCIQQDNANESERGQ